MRLSTFPFLQQTLVVYIKTIRRQMKVLRAGKSPAAVKREKDEEAVHQIRVHARRLCNMLWFFKNFWPERDYKQWIADIKTMAQACSRTRDLDVQAAFLNQLCAQRTDSFEPAEKAAIEKFVTVLSGRRDDAQPKMTDAIRRFRQTQTLPAIIAAVHRESKRIKRKDAAWLLKKAEKKICKRVKQLFAFEPFVTQPSRVKELHQMRIAVKHLRYTLEGLQPVYGRRVSPMIKTVLSFHRLLGELHDYDVWLAVFLGKQEFPGIATVDTQPLSHVVAYCRKERRGVHRRFVQAWQAARDKRFFEELLELARSYVGADDQGV